MNENFLNDTNSDFLLVKSLLLKDLEKLYQNIDTFDLQSGNNFMFLLKYAKEKKYFDDNFMDYWFIKALNNSNNFDFFILDKDNYEFFGYTAKSLSSLLEIYCSPLIAKGGDERAIGVIKKSLENDCFFENDYLNKLKESSFFDDLLKDDFDIFMKKNITNFHNYLNQGKNENISTKEKKVKI